MKRKEKVKKQLLEICKTILWTFFYSPGGSLSPHFDHSFLPTSTAFNENLDEELKPKSNMLLGL
jgi:hypothetical protein